MLSIYSYLLTLSLCCFIAFSAAAQTGNCVVFSTDGTAFHLGIDNKFQNAEAHTNVKITSISEGDYWVTIMFYNQLHKAIKTSIRVIEDKEIAYHLIQDGSVWKLQQYSSVPKGQVKTLQTGQTVQAYNKSGVAVKGLKSADQIDPNNIARQETIRRVQGDHKDHEKRMGQFSGANGTKTPETSDEPTQALPTTGTTIINEYLEVENTDGTSKIIDQRTTIIKEIVERNGQKQLRTKKNKTQIDTDFNCLPIAKDTFLALKTAVKTATDKTSEVGYWSAASVRAGAVRVHSTGMVAQTIQNRATAYADGGVTTGSEADNTVIREGIALRRNGNEILVDLNIGGTVTTLSLGTAS